KTPGSDQHKIIPLTLQLLIENVFKHNSATEEHPLHITIHTDDNYLMVENNIQPSTSVEKRGIGLKYLSKQYELYTKEVVVKQTDEAFNVRNEYIARKEYLIVEDVRIAFEELKRMMTTLPSDYNVVKRPITDTE